MSYRLQLEKNFIKHYRKLTVVERELVDDKLRILARDPWHPSLRTKRIKGTREFEVSVNMDIRMAISFDGEKLIIMLDIDHHDKLLKRRSSRR
ncbi:MAG: type II toxin-antitoxin system RelE/ParE family toxin [Eggerthellaceae bacterium]